MDESLWASHHGPKRDRAVATDFLFLANSERVYQTTDGQTREGTGCVSFASRGSEGGLDLVKLRRDSVLPELFVRELLCGFGADCGKDPLLIARAQRKFA